MFITDNIDTTKCIIQLYITEYVYPYTIQYMIYYTCDYQCTGGCHNKPTFTLPITVEQL